MLISSTKKFSIFTRLLHITGLLRLTKLSRNQTLSRADLLSLGTAKSLSPELAEAMRRAARQAKEENIDIEEPIEGDLGL